MKINHKKWTDNQLPKKVLFIRIQAMGDVMITQPYIKGFHESYPDIKIHFLTREEDQGIPFMFDMFDKIWRIKGGRNKYLQLFYGTLLIPVLLFQRYDIIYDLQDHKISRIIRFILRSKAWTVFDRFSPVPAGERTYEAIKTVGLNDFAPDYSKIPIALNLGREFLKRYSHSENLIIINPAGFFESRNWPESYYLGWAKLMMNYYDGDVTFMFVGIERIRKIAENFHKKYPDNTLNLVNKTSPSEAFGLVQNAKFMLSEDSGLMHMSWISGVPTLALFGSSRSDWSRPLGNHSLLLGSADLECGNCLLRTCKFNDNRCLTRYTPEIVFEYSIKLLEQVWKRN